MIIANTHNRVQILKPCPVYLMMMITICCHAGNEFFLCRIMDAFILQEYVFFLNVNIIEYVWVSRQPNPAHSVFTMLRLFWYKPQLDAYPDMLKLFLNYLESWQLCTFKTSEVDFHYVFAGVFFRICLCIKQRSTNTVDVWYSI